MKTFAPKLLIGDAIGIICPSHVPDPARHKRSISVLKSLGVDDYNVETDGVREQGFTSFLIDRSGLNKSK